MKTKHIAIALLIAAALTSCVTRTTTITSPDGTVSVTKTSAPDAASVAAVSLIAQTRVRPEK